MTWTISKTNDNLCIDQICVSQRRQLLHVVAKFVLYCQTDPAEQHTFLLQQEKHVDKLVFLFQEYMTGCAWMEVKATHIAIRGLPVHHGTCCHALIKFQLWKQNSTVPHTALTHKRRFADLGECLCFSDVTSDQHLVYVHGWLVCLLGLHYCVSLNRLPSHVRQDWSMSITHMGPIVSYAAGCRHASVQKAVGCVFWLFCVKRNTSVIPSVPKPQR